VTGRLRHVWSAADVLALACGVLPEGLPGLPSDQAELVVPGCVTTWGVPDAGERAVATEWPDGSAAWAPEGADASEWGERRGAFLIGEREIECGPLLVAPALWLAGPS
jgi:hypothetical protein